LGRAPTLPTIVLTLWGLLAGGVASAEPDDRAPLIGVQLDAGFPDGAVLAGAYRPVRYARFDGGLSYNLIGFGLRAGATAIPWDSVIAPTVRAEVGHVFESDASGFIGHFADLSAEEKQALSKVSYTYAGLHVGAEVGSPDTAIVFLRVGVSWYWTALHDYPALVHSLNPNATASGDASVTGRILSLHVGVLIYVW